MADGYTLKEMVGELRNEQKQLTVHTSGILVALQNIDAHLAQLNSKVAAHELKVSKLETFQSKAMVVWGFAVFIMVTVANKFI